LLFGSTKNINPSQGGRGSQQKVKKNQKEESKNSLKFKIFNFYPFPFVFYLNQAYIKKIKPDLLPASPRYSK